MDNRDEKWIKSGRIGGCVDKKTEIVQVKDTGRVKRLFAGWEETMIWSCLQGIMGAVYAEKEGLPRAAKAVLGDFVFLAGEPSKELLFHQTYNKKEDFRILVPQNDEWEELIESTYGKQAEKIRRIAIQKEPGIWKKARLEQFVQELPKEYELRLIDRELYELCRQQEWSQDLVSQFPDYEIYRKWGLGVAVLSGTELVCGASSYSRYKEGIEIEIDTKEGHKRKGLATACAARLILECQERGIYPSWDAHTEASAALAEKLGYHRGEAYTAYILNWRHGVFQPVGRKKKNLRTLTRKQK